MDFAFLVHLPPFGSAIMYCRVRRLFYFVFGGPRFLYDRNVPPSKPFSLFTTMSYMNKRDNAAMVKTGRGVKKLEKEIKKKEKRT